MTKKITTAQKQVIAEVAATRAVGEIKQGYTPSTFRCIKITLQTLRPDCFDNDEMLISRTQYDDLAGRFQEQVKFQLTALARTGWKFTPVKH